MGLSKSKDLDGRIVQNTNEVDSAYEYSFQQQEALGSYVFDIDTIVFWNFRHIDHS